MKVTDESKNSKRQSFLTKQYHLKYSFSFSSYYLLGTVLITTFILLANFGTAQNYREFYGDTFEKVVLLLFIMLFSALLGLLKSRTRKSNRLLYTSSFLISGMALVALHWVLLVNLCTFIIYGFGPSAEDRLPPDPISSEIASQREKTYAQIAKAFSELDTDIPLQKYATSSHDQCHKGFDNYKTSDGYANKCQYKVSQYYGFKGDFKQKMIEIRDHLVAHGWKSGKDMVFPQSDTIDAMLANYYDKEVGQERPYSGGKTFRICDLYMSMVNYSKDKSYITMDASERDGCDTFSMEYFQTVSGHIYDFYNVEKFQNIKELTTQITSQDQYMVVIGMQQTYFEN